MDPVNHPEHYQKASIAVIIEPIQLAEMYDFCIGNAIKYILRAPYKGNEKQDLEKAKWYLDRAWLKFFNLSRRDTEPGTNLLDTFIPTDYIKPNANLMDSFIINSFKLNNKYIKLLIMDNNGWISRESIRATIDEITKSLKSVV